MWEPDGAIWEATVTRWELHGSQMRATWEWHALYGSHLCHMGAGWSHMGGMWELQAPHGSHLSYMGATCNIQGHMGSVCRGGWHPYGSCMHCMGAIG
jgi:hypothetical protein